MKTMRLVVAGSVGAGKSTFVRTLSEIEVVDTDRTATDETALFKSETTVALDFGRFMLGPHMDLHLYGTPGLIRGHDDAHSAHVASVVLTISGLDPDKRTERASGWRR